MSHIPSVTYKAHRKNKTFYKEKHICFSGLSSKIPDDNFTKINYLARVRSSLKKNEVIKYFKFLEQFLDKDKFKYKIYPFKKKKVLFSLNCDGMKADKALLYLTAARYVDDFPELVKDTVVQLTGDPQTDYDIFAEIHKKYHINSGDLTYNNLAGHGLMYSYYSPKFVKFCDYKTFLGRFSDTNAKSVQAHFSI